LSEETTRSEPGAGAERLDLEPLKAVHRGAMRSNLVFAVALAAAGVAVLLLGIAGSLDWLLALIVGVMVLTLALFPLQQTIENRERVEGLEVLSEEWKEMTGRGEATSANRDRFLELLAKLYGKVHAQA